MAQGGQIPLSVIEDVVKSLQRLQTDTKGQRRVPLFATSDNAREWLTWRRRFEMIADAHKWSDEQRRQELFIGMTGDAAASVADIDVMAQPTRANPNRGYATIQEVLAAYEARFMTQADSDAARAEFLTARQLSSESILAWHSRLRDLFSRAFQGEDINQGASGYLGRERFILGLDNASIREHTLNERPSTYQEALKVAENRMASLKMLQADRKKGLHALPGPSSRETSASAYPPQEGGCFICDGPHFARECPQKRAAGQGVWLPGRNGGNTAMRAVPRGRGGLVGRNRGAPATPRGKGRGRGKSTTTGTTRGRTLPRPAWRLHAMGTAVQELQEAQDGTYYGDDELPPLYSGDQEVIEEEEGHEGN